MSDLVLVVELNISKCGFILPAQEIIIKFNLI